VVDADTSSERLAIIVKSDSFEDLLLALSFAGIAASAGQAVAMFFTNRAARRLKLGGFDDVEESDAVGREFIDGAHGMGFRDLRAMMGDVKQTGRVRIFLCSRGARIWDIDQDSMIPEVDSVMGTASFLLEEVRAAHSVITI
jgi:peroxiredoxin family protein